MAEQRRLTLSAGQRSHWEQRLRRPDGTECTLELEFTPVPKDAARPTHWIGILRDVTERMVQFATLEHQALYDFLTGLPNRILLCDRLDQAILAGDRESTPLALFVLDLDRFKEVNDALGHPAGDVLLKQIGARLRGTLRTVDTVARLGGDEFGILLPGSRGPSGRGSDGGEDREGARGAVRGRRQQPGRLRVDRDRPLPGAWQRLDDADAKRRCGHVRRPRSRAGAIRCMPSARARRARVPCRSCASCGRESEATRFHLRYQPLADLASRRVIDVEALVRWQHPRRGLMLSEEFLPGAERAGVTPPLFEWALETALGHCRGWREAGLRLSVALNVSERVLRDPVLPDRISGLLRPAGPRSREPEARGVGRQYRRPTPAGSFRP